MKKLVLFDLDGTLIDSIDDLADSTNYALQECGLPLHTVEEYKYFVGNSVDPLIRRALPKEDQDNQELFDRVKKIYLSRYASSQQGQNQALSRNCQFTFPMQQRRCIDCGGFQ